ncbi:MAG: tRNA lysidine(34) synthetase TilS [Gammaproteobacteria bacterium]|nr:tRNA lysidine(34) synthetase TilS [Gammaproteobacteria bacterium]
MASSAKLDPQTLLATLKQLPAFNQIKTWWLAYSGGVDSQVLLHLLAQLRLDVRAVYIDHGLQAESADWAMHCEQSCQALNISFQSISVNAQAEKRQSPEAAARTARYAALRSFISSNDCLLTAQHKDDQAETCLLQLFRGSGAAGLAAMPVVAPFGDGLHCRPLLEFSREQILAYAAAHDLQWVDDPSNEDDKYDRNYLRHQVIPGLKQRWPGLDKTLYRAASQQAENKHLLDELASEDLQKLSSTDESLSMEELSHLSESRLRNVIRYWLRISGLPVPSREVMQQIMLQMFQGDSDAQPIIGWAEVELRRYQGRIYALKLKAHNAGQCLDWNPQQALCIESLNQNLKMRSTDKQGLSADMLKQKLQVRFRRGGEKIKPAGRNGSHSLKKLFQEAAVPPWQRDRIPLIYSDNELIAVADYWVADQYVAAAGDQQYRPCLEAQQPE